VFLHATCVLTATRDNSILNLVISREPDLVSNVSVIENLGNSDHNMVKFTVHHISSVKSSKIHHRDYSRGNYQQINNYLSTVDWSSLMSGSVNECWTQFKQIVLDLEQKYIPLKPTTRIAKHKWMTHKALWLVRRKHRIYTRYKDKQHPAVKKANKDACKELRRARQKFERKLAQNIKSDNKSFFAYVRVKQKPRFSLVH